MAKPYALLSGMTLIAAHAIAQASPKLAQQAPLVAVDAGPAIPVAPYVAYLIAGVDQPGVLAGLTFPLTSAMEPGTLKQPIEGVLAARWMTHPIFLIGADAAALDWLRANGRALARAGATGIVMRAASETDFKRVQLVADAYDLPVAPGPAPWLEQHLVAAGAGVLPLVIDLQGRAVQRLEDAS